MAFDNLFCPIKSNKPKLSKKSSPRISRTSENVPNNIASSSGGSSKQTTTPCSFVRSAFQAQLEDEISVIPGDTVICQYTDNESGGIWTHVLCLRTNKVGFVPTEILSKEPLQDIKCKKMPRYPGDSTGHHHQSHHSSVGHHRHHGHFSNKPLTGEDNQHSLRVRMFPELRDHHHHNHHHPPQRLNIPNSLQGSSGQRTLPKYPDLRYLCSTGYYNLNSFDSHRVPNDMECRPMHLTDCGRYVVLHNFVAQEEKDINVDLGEVVTVLNKDDPDWYWICRHDDGKGGFVPANFMCQYEQVEAVMNKGNSTATMKSSNPIDFHTYINHKPESLKESLPTDQQSLFLNV